MIIAITAQGKEWGSQVDPRFGRAKYIVFYNDETEELNIFDNSDIESVAHGAGPRTAQKIFEHKANVLITGNGPGGNAGSVLRQAKMEIYVGAGSMTVKAAYEAYKSGKLQKA